MLELLWVRDAAEASGGPARDLRFPERAAAAQTSPFGLIFRQSQETGQAMPFPGWSYHPAYFDDARFFHVGENSTELHEPLCVHMPFSIPASVERLRNDIRLLNVTVHVACEQLSEVLQAVNQVRGLTVRAARQHFMELTIDADAGEDTLDLRPELPLAIRVSRS